MISAERFDVYGSVESPDADKGCVCSPWQHRADGTDGLSVTQLLKELQLTPFANAALGDYRWVCNQYAVQMCMSECLPRIVPR